MANRYENASPKDETWYQIKCPHCGFIDATQDKYKWKCPECDVKVKKVVTAPIKIPDNIKLETKPATKETMKLIEEKAKEMQATNQAIKETKAIQHAAEHEIEKTAFIEAFHKVLGTKPAEPATVKSEFKVGQFACKIVSTRKN